MLLFAGAALSMTDPALAQDESAVGRAVYDRGFFAQFSPTNALEMIQRVPGFVLEIPDKDLRGFGQAAGNVVINDQRPSSKSDALDTILSRIPASNVVRIELASGSAFGADFAGKPQVVNVVLSEEGGLSGTLEGKLTTEYIGRVLPDVQASMILRTGASAFSGSFRFDEESATEEGYDKVTDLATGNQIEFRGKTSRNTQPVKTVALGWALEQASDRSAHVNARLSIDPWYTDQRHHILPAQGDERHDIYTEDHLWRTYELSGDLARPLAGGALKFNALATRRHRQNEDKLVRTVSGVQQSGFLQTLEDWRDERVGRVAWSRAGLSGWTIEIGIEGAYNRLKSGIDVFNIEADGTLDPVDLPITHAIVAEFRGEAFWNAGRNISRNLHIDLGLNYEGSRLTVTGDAHSRHVLKFLKPKASIDWSSGVWHAQFGVSRTVAQLDFADFVGGASITTNQISSGNADLVPQRAWELLLSVDRRVLGDGRVKIELGYDLIGKVQDRVPTADGFDAPGNLGNGKQFTAKFNLDLPLAWIGIRGGRVSMSGTYLGMSVIDPYTMLSREFTDKTAFTYQTDFRQDLGAFAWGMGMKGTTGTTSFRRLETDTLKGISPRVTGFVEYRPSARSTVTFGVDNLTNALTKRIRYFYNPDRSALTPFLRENRQRNIHVKFYLSIKHSI